MTSRFTRSYLKRLRSLPHHVQKRAVKAIKLLEGNERYPSLHFKEVSMPDSAWSIRVSQDYRMVGYREAGTVTWFWIGKHDDYDTLLNQMA